VTGMILTFQSITLFGAGDPRLMAGGISQALMTTVLGLCVAIPMLLLHNVVSARAKTLTQILKQRAVALVAYRAEVAAGAAGRGDLQ
jgi:biopolymer transport protein ExbB